MIIEELDREGINLQETKLNLEHQGYKWYWDLFVGFVWDKAIFKRTSEITHGMLNEINNPTAEELLK